MIRLGKCMRVPVRCMLALAALILIQTAFAFAAEQVDLLLVLSSDVSRSVDHPKFLLQREGYAAAISDPHVMDAIKSGPQQRIALCFVEWASNTEQAVVIDEELFEFLSVLRHPLLGFEVLVEQRQREVPEVDLRDKGTGLSGGPGGDGHELLVEGLPAEAPGEGQNAWPDPVSCMVGSPSGCLTSRPAGTSRPRINDEPSRGALTTCRSPLPLLVLLGPPHRPRRRNALQTRNPPAVR